MKKVILSLIAFFVIISSQTQASHIAGGELKIEHQQGFDYRVSMILYRDVPGIAAPASPIINIYQRDGANLIESITLNLDSAVPMIKTINGCVTTGYDIDINYYSFIKSFDPNIYNHSGGYLLTYDACCRNQGVVNVQNVATFGSNYTLLIPPIVKNGVPFVNSSPILETPIEDVAFVNNPYSIHFGGIDLDGDSLDHVFYTPFSNGVPGTGTSSALTSPYSDPTTQFSSVSWGPGINLSNIIPGTNTQNSLSINSAGVLSMTPASQGLFLCGIWTREYRNGELIGSVFRDFRILVLNAAIPVNNPPVIETPQNQTLATWNGDTLIFTGSPVCVQLDVTDPDSTADISLEIVQSNYDPLDISFVQSKAVIQNNDTFNTALCFMPDSFLSIVSEAKVMAFDNICHNVKSDTLSFYFRFDGYSNAGTGGNTSIPISSSLGNLDLFSYLNGNPNSGGTWLDLDNTGMLSNGQFDASGISSDVSYRFAYVDQQPNYPADSAELELNFFIVQSLKEPKELSEVSIYPNPSSGNITLKVSEALIGKTVYVYTLDSRKVQRFNLDSNTNTIYIEKSGMYLIKVEGNSQVHKVFIKN